MLHRRGSSLYDEMSREMDARRAKARMVSRITKCMMVLVPLTALCFIIALFVAIATSEDSGQPHQITADPNHSSSGIKVDTDKHQPTYGKIIVENPPVKNKPGGFKETW